MPKCNYAHIFALYYTPIIYCFLSWCPQPTIVRVVCQSKVYIAATHMTKVIVKETIHFCCTDVAVAC